MEEKLLYKIQVKGRVQGVGFRKQLNAYVEWRNKGPGVGFVESVTADAFPHPNTYLPGCF